MKKRILIIGYGSIGRKHALIINKFFKNETKALKIFTKQKIKNSLYSRNQVLDFNPDYIIVANETSKHFETLKFLEKNFKKKIILVEKPLFHKKINYKIKKNYVFVGYNLRFHPILDFVIKKIKNKKIYFVNAECSSYLPNWRKNINYKNSSSAFKDKGGGVLLDLSHELDYLKLIFGIKKIYSVFNKKISELKINTDDILVTNFLSKKSALVNLVQSYFSRIARRTLVIDGKKISIKANFLDNTVVYKKNENMKTYKKYFIMKPNDMYIAMHKCIFKKKFKKLCSYNEAVNLLKLIDKIKKFKA
jgi:CMP-N,N'-diacetyllegionaminic acid synthase